MTPMQLLDDALNEGKNFASAAGRLRDKFKAGTAALKEIEAEAVDVVNAAVAKARDGLAAFKAEVEKVEEAEGKSDDDDKKDEAPAPVVDLSAGTTTHTAADGTVTTLDHEAGTITAKDVDGATAIPLPAAIEAVVQAAVEAGAAVPDTVIRGADVPDTTPPTSAAEPVIA